MKKIQLQEYLTRDGKNPFRQWLEDLDIITKARIQARAFWFEEGNFGDHKSVGKGIWEARLHFGAGHRVYFGKDGENNSKFAKEFLLSVIDDGISLQVALGKIIRAIGIKEFSKKAKMADSNIIRAIDPKYNPTQDTLNRLLKPLGLRLTVTALDEEKGAGK